MNLIVAVDKNWAIGCSGSLLISIPKDLVYFKKLTTGKVIVTGRKTTYTFPNKNPLINRTNIVLSKFKDILPYGFIVVNSLDEALAEISRYNLDDIFIIGGESIYSLFLPYCNTAYVTKIHASFKADRYMENLDMLNEWQLAEEIYDYTCTPCISFCKYIRCDS